MKKKKLKLSLNKSTIATLQVKKMKNILGGGGEHNTMDVYCANHSMYPACAVSGCWGAQSCYLPN